MGGVMGFSLRRSVRLAATLGTGVLTVWIIASLDSLGVTDFKNSDAAVPLEDRGGKTLLSAGSEPFYAPHDVNADTGTAVRANKVTEEWDEFGSSRNRVTAPFTRVPVRNAERADRDAEHT